MSNQPEALRLAELLDAYHMAPHHKQAAAELRRLAAVEAQRDALLEAARDALSVCASVNTSRYSRIERDDGVLYAQTEEWCQWIEHEVGPKLRAAIKAVEEGK